MNKITIERAVLEQVLEALESIAISSEARSMVNVATTALSETLAQSQPAQEPVKGWWAHTCPEDGKVDVVNYQLTPADKRAGWVEHEVYTSPQAQPLPVQPTANSGDAEKAVLNRMAKYVSTITQSEIDEADSDRGITSPQAQAAHGITKGTT